MVKVEVGQQWRNNKTGRVFTVAKQETPVQYVVIQPAATIYTTAEEAKAQAMRMAKTSGGVWAVGRVEGRAVAQPPAPVPPKWEDAPYGG